MSKYLLFYFSFLFMPFFLHWLQSFSFFTCRSPLFLSFFLMPFFFSSLGDELFSFFFSFFSGGLVSTVVLLLFFFSSFWGAPHFFLIIFGVELFFLVSFFFWGALCFLSLLPSPEQAVWNRTYVLSRFPDRVDILVDQVVTIPWTTCKDPGTKYVSCTIASYGYIKRT